MRKWSDGNYSRKYEKCRKELRENACRKINKGLGMKVYKKSAKGLLTKVCKKFRKELGKKASKESRIELGKNYARIVARKYPRNYEINVPANSYTNEARKVKEQAKKVWCKSQGSPQESKKEY